MDLLSADQSDTLFEQFLTERRFLKNVTSDTLDWYRTAFKALQKAEGQAAPLIAKSTFDRFVTTLRGRGVKAISCNTHLKALNAFCVWLHENGHTATCIRVPLLKTEIRVLVTLTDEQMRALLSSKPKRFDQWRLRAVIALVLDTGVRIDEALGLRTKDVDLDNLLLTVAGKGRKERRVPFSFELRKTLFRYEQIRKKTCSRTDLFFPSRCETRWNQRNSLRALHLHEDRLGLPRFGWHRLRHTFATNYLRAGGEVVRLSRVLGHTQITTTMRYVHLLTDDLQVTQHRVSLLNRLA